jgi:hypothetical protein
MKTQRNRKDQSQAEQPQVTRKSGRHIRVPVLPNEGEVIDGKARICRISTAAYLRNLGLGHEPSEAVAPDIVRQLWEGNRELNRIGGLLEGWLTDDPLMSHQQKATLSRNVQGLLAELREAQAALLMAATRF